MQFPSIPRLRALLASLPLAAALHSQNIDRYISAASGDNGHDGLTAATAWQTVAYAQAQIEGLIPGQNADIVLHFAPGEYPQSSTLGYTTADAPQPGYTISYVSDAGPGQAAIVGAAGVGANWAQIPGTPIWTTHLTLGFVPEVIYEAGLPSWPARSPKRTNGPRYSLARSGYATAAAGTGSAGSGDLIKFNSADFPGVTSWTLAHAQLQWWRGEDVRGIPRDWGINAADSITGLDGTTGFYLTHDTNDTPAAGERYYVENVPELLTAAGEFTYDPASGTLNYYPRAANPNSADIRVPTLDSILTITGDSSTHAHVHDLIFDGLKFAYSRNDNSGQFGAVTVQIADHVTFTRCEFSSVGSCALLLNGENANHTISHCWIHGCGVGGIWIQNLAQRGPGSLYPSTAHTVTDCLIHDIGEVEPNALYSAGVLLWSADHCSVDHCEIYNSVRYATSLRGSYNQDAPNDSGRYVSIANTFADLRVHDCLMDSGDGGAIHAAGLNEASGPDINTWNQILIAGCYADPSMTDIGPDGMFLDYPNQTLGQVLENIDITFTQNASGGDKGFRTNGNGGTYTGSGSPGQSMSNVSWLAGFSLSGMDFSNIGLTSTFPRTSFALLPNYPAAEVDGVSLADDHTSDISLTGSWSDSMAPGLLNGDGNYHVANGSGDYAEWRPTLPYTGAYQVSAWQIPGIAGASSGAPIAITDRNGTTSETLDQLDGGSGWKTYLPTFTFFAGRGTANGYVRLTATTGGAVRADAIEFAYLGSANVSMGGETGWWKFDSDATDSSGSGLNGVGAGSPGYGSPHAVGTGALQLDGSSYVSVAKSSLLDIGTGNFAVSLWFYLTDSGASNERLVAKGADTTTHAGYCLFAGATTVSAAIGNGASRIIVTAPHGGLNAWNHVVLNVDRSGDATVYVNGVNAASADISGWSGMDLSNTGWNFYLGSNAGSLDWKGAIDDVRVYRRLLTDAEIQSLFRP